MTPCNLIIPCYRDAESLELLIPELKESCASAGLEARVVIVNDYPYRDAALEQLCAAQNAVLIQVPYNMGHQEAIVYGIKRCVDLYPPIDDTAEVYVTLDADGQDDPRAINKLVEAVRPGVVAVAKRAGQRPEDWKFRVLYAIHKRAFRVLVGFYPDFGNFAAFDGAVARHIAVSPHFDLAYSLALPLVAKLHRVPIKRLPRLKGESRFSAEGLIDHAFRLFIPHWKKIVRRVFMASTAIIAFSLLFGLFIVGVRLFAPQYAFPNWASIINFGVVMVSLQLLTLSALTFFVGSISRQISITARQIVLRESRTNNTETSPLNR